MPKTSIIVNLQVEGLHRWQDAMKVEPKVGYLANLHRHMFHITAEKEVTHQDRDIEIILFKRSIYDYLQSQYFNGDYGCLDFDTMSCEMIASELLDEFDLDSVLVLEDNENGARLSK